MQAHNQSLVNRHFDVIILLAVKKKREREREREREKKVTLGAFHLGKKTGNFGGSEGGISDW